jgi:hypothetical protein
MPYVISGAPSRGIGETRNEGFKAKSAKSSTAPPEKYNSNATMDKNDASLKIGAFGFKNRSPRRPNCSPTKRRALKIIFCHRTNDLANPVLLDHLHDPDNDLSLLRL